MVRHSPWVIALNIGVTAAGAAGAVFAWDGGHTFSAVVDAIVSAANGFIVAIVYAQLFYATKPTYQHRNQHARGF